MMRCCGRREWRKSRVLCCSCTSIIGRAQCWGFMPQLALLTMLICDHRIVDWLVCNGVETCTGVINVARSANRIASNSPW